MVNDSDNWSSRVSHQNMIQYIKNNNDDSKNDFILAFPLDGSLSE